MISGRERFRRHEASIRGLRRFLSHFPAAMVTAVLLPFMKLPGSMGALCRYLHWSRRLGSLGDVASLATNIIIKSPHQLTIGDRCSIHEFCYVDALGGISIGNDVAIAHGCSVLSTNHSWDDRGTPIKYNPVKFAPVEICDDVWIGCGVRILAGSKISGRVVVAAGSVVKGELESGYIYGGIPAKKLKPL